MSRFKSGQAYMAGLAQLAERLSCKQQVAGSGPAVGSHKKGKMMKVQIIEVTGTSYPDARELPNKGGRPAAKLQKSTSSSGARKPPSAVPPALPAQRMASQEATAANRKVLLITVKGKRRWLRESDYRAGRY
jgi:hypothetical protein